MCDCNDIEELEGELEDAQNEIFYLEQKVGDLKSEKDSNSKWPDINTIDDQMKKEALIEIWNKISLSDLDSLVI